MCIRDRSAAVTDPQLVADAVARWGAERIAVGVDARGGKVRTAGWVEDSGLDYCEFARSMEAVSYTHLDVYKRQVKHGKTS